MLMDEEVPLFGAAPGRIVDATLSVTVHDALRTVKLSGRPENKRAPMVLLVTHPQEDPVQDIVGRMVSIMLRSNNVGANVWRRTLWAIHNVLGREGYEVSIQGCGKDPMKNR